jgi:hypothetical protein
MPNTPILLLPARSQPLARGDRLPPFNRQLDALLVTRGSADALSALPETVRLYPPQQVLWVGDPLASQAGLDTCAALLEAGRKLQAAQPGMALDGVETHPLRLWIVDL